MKIWIDAQISPTIAQYGVGSVAIKDLGLRDAIDRDIFLAAREAKAPRGLKLGSGMTIGLFVGSSSSAWRSSEMYWGSFQ